MGELHDRFFGLSSAERDVLRQLFFNGPTFDGDLSSKQGRSDLIAKGLAFGVEGYNSLTMEGVQHAVAIDLDTAKERRDRERRAQP